MAEIDPEFAFLQSQKEYDPAADFSAALEQPTNGDNDHDDADADGDGDEDEYDPSAAYASYTAPDEQPLSEHSASRPESAVNTPPIAAADAALKPPPAEAGSATPSKQQPRTKGGFVDESEDDDEDEVPVSKPLAAGAALLNANGVSDEPQPSLSHTPNNTLAPSNVQVHSAQDLGPSGVSSSNVVPNDAAISHSPAAAATTAGTPVPDVTKPALPSALNIVSARPSTAPATPDIATLPKARLPQDRVGILEDRIADDPRGDVEAWLSLIEEHRKRHKYEDARAIYDRFFKVFPTAAEQWVEFVNMELALEELKRVERIFERSIATNPHVELWSTYINYTRRIHNVTTDEARTRTVITQVFEFVLDGIGIDVDSGKIWKDYIEFIKSGPGNLGGAGGGAQSSWQDGQKMDSLRKVYQRAVSVPHNATMDIWREYDKFELTHNKINGRKNLQERSPSYMTARSYNNVLENILKKVNRTTLPTLPPVKGFDGDEQYEAQVKAWKEWIQFEKDDPLVLRDSDRALYNKRVLYLYKQALTALRFWPDLWYDAAEWCFQNDLEKDGSDLLTQGIDANPESCLLAFRQAAQIELKGDFEEGEVGLRKGEAVREPFNKLLTTLYDLANKTKKREEHSLARAKETFAAQQAAEEAAIANAAGDSDDEDVDREAEIEKRRKLKDQAFSGQLKAISRGFNDQVLTLKKTISYAWIALMRSMRRIQGKGRPDPPAGTPPGFRGIFAEARKKGKLLSDAYVASALIEHHCYQDPAATKIFDRGMKLFPDDEHFALEYIKHLVNQNDGTNARAVFETVVSKLTQKPENVPRAKALFAFFHEYESRYGELSQIVKLEKRMGDLFPEDPQLARFASRFSVATFDPTSVLPVISLKSQMRPKLLSMPPVLPPIVPTVEEPIAPTPQVQDIRPSPVLNSPRIPAALLPATNSPKRPFEDVDNELAQPRKIIRGESPLKGAAGRRLDAARRNQTRASDGASAAAAQPTPIPTDIKFLLSVMPPAHRYDSIRFNPEKVVALLQHIELDRANVGQNQLQHQVAQPVQPVAQPPPMLGQPMGQWGPPPPGGVPGYYGR